MNIKDIIELFEYMEEHTNMEMMEKIEELQKEISKMRSEISYMRKISEGKINDFELSEG